MFLRTKQRLNRWERTIRLLGLSGNHESQDQPGLIMIQIDGFPKRELEKAIDRNEMPFLKKLLTHEKYRMHAFYPGLPSTTPAVQGELFYGVKQAVPAFFFFDRQSQSIFKMFDGAAVREMESRLAKQGRGLLEGGSSYSNIYSGGAAETHFCAGSLGWGHIWKDVNVFNFILLLVTHFVAVVRMLVLCIWETFLAVADCVHGLIKREDVSVELKFIYLRVFLGLLLRELITVGALMDIARGLPIIHLNFLGYDEQAHRRQPDSQSAHWVLKGIDKSIERIYSAAIHSHKRHYEVWVYSDHGQEATIPYVTFHHQTVESAVTSVFERLFENKSGGVGEKSERAMNRHRGIQGQRVRYLSQLFSKLCPANQDDRSAVNPDVLVAAMGPLGGVYVFKELSHEKKIQFAKELVGAAKIPLVLLAEAQGKVRAWNEHGEHLLPQDAAKILSPSHPFFDEAIQDLMSLCHHPNAGTLTISGWRPNGKPFSFPFENGAHAGPGNHETNAFALIPSHINPHLGTRQYLRPTDLREAALRFLKKEKQQLPQPSDLPRRVRIMTYNVHSCVGMDGRLSPQRIARVIARYEPDIVALQELDGKRKRTGHVDQAQLIAQELKMNYHFYPSIRIEEEKFGNAILSRYPLELIKTGQLPGMNRFKLEPRGALWVAVNIGGVRLQVINTHLAIYAPESRIQARHLVGSEWIGHHDGGDPIVLCGDFNNMPNSTAWRTLNDRLTDAQLLLERHRPMATWFGHYPIGRIDHIFVSKGVKVFAVDVPKTQLDKMASDHLPLIADVEIYGPLEIKNSEGSHENKKRS